MVQCEDFLEWEAACKPFKKGIEETKAYLGWLDMLLFSYGYMRDLEEQEETKKQEAARIRKELRRGWEYLEGRSLLSLGQEICYEEGYGINHLAERFSLRDFSFFLFLLGLAPQLDEKYVLVYESLYEKEEPYRGLTFALGRRLYYFIWGGREKFSGETTRHKLQRIPIFQFMQDQMQGSFLLDRITLHPVIAELLRGEYGLAEEFAELCEEPEDEALSAEVIGRKEELKKLKNVLKDSLKDSRKRLIHISGKRGSGRKLLILKAKEDCALTYINLEILLSKEGKRQGELLKGILLRCKGMGKIPVLTNGIGEKEKMDSLTSLLRDAFQLVNLVVLTSEETANRHLLAQEFPYFYLSLPEIRVKERGELWSYYLKGEKIEEGLKIEALASTYHFTPGMILGCIRQAGIIARAEASEEIRREHIKQAVHHFNSSKIAELATHIPAAFSWDDLEIGPEQKEVMRLACSRVGLKNVVDEEWGFDKKVSYGKGMSVLLYGPPGTGKTMAAQIMAGEIGMELYRIDLSQLVDKYIGETQKKIGKVFACAKEGNFILFFDEADALFSKRTEVQNANDKHANTEINYLLQKMEEYDGISILATNRFDHFDAAFVRRITYTVCLEKPDETVRLRLFQSILPPQAKVEEELDFAFFASRFELTGSNIKAVLYNAAFMAAAEGKGIRNQDIAKAIKYEYAKLGKIAMTTEFGRYASFVS